MTLDDILVEINNAEKIAIMAHETPDGDAIGSILAMYLALKKIGKKPDAIIKEFPAPRGNEDAPLKCLIFDSYYD